MITVIIPTYKRLQVLLQALRSLQKQTLAEFEIIVVDNAVERDVQRAVTDFASTSRVPVQWAPSSAPSVLHEARHTGARLARGEILVFTDDDATFDAGWLQAYAEAFDCHPAMAAAGGPVRPIWEVSPPEWLVQYMGDGKSFGILSLMEPFDKFVLGPKAFFWGVNMAIRREALFAVGGFNPEVFGDTWLGDGESGLSHKLARRGMQIGYVPQALVHHHIPPGRMTVDYLCRRLANQEACDIYTSCHRRMPRRWRLGKDVVATALRKAKYLIAARFFRGGTDERSLWVQSEAARTWARLNYLSRLIWSKKFRALVLKEDWLSRAGAPAQVAV